MFASKGILCDINFLPKKTNTKRNNGTIGVITQWVRKVIYLFSNWSYCVFYLVPNLRIKIQIKITRFGFTETFAFLNRGLLNINRIILKIRKCVTRYPFY